MGQTLRAGELVKLSSCEAIRLNPKNAWAYFNRGHTWARIGRIEESRADLKEAARLDASYAR
jgi:Flp pilus assembly protein TadD